MMRRVLTNATVIDCVTPRPIPGASVVIDRGRIVEVLDGSRSPDTRSGDVVHLGGPSLLPRLWDPHTRSCLPAGGLDAAFEICRKRGFRVMAHAANPETVVAAARRGAHSVEHGYIMDGACIEALRAHATWYVPTLAITQLTPDQARAPREKRGAEPPDLSPDLPRRADAAPHPPRRSFRRDLAPGRPLRLLSRLRPPP